MDVWVVVMLVAIAVLVLLPFVAMTRMWLRLRRGDEEMQPGGSMGLQMFGRDRSD